MDGAWPQGFLEKTHIYILNYGVLTVPWYLVFNQSHQQFLDVALQLEQRSNLKRHFRQPIWFKLVGLPSTQKWACLLTECTRCTRSGFSRSLDWQMPQSGDVVCTFDNNYPRFQQTPTFRPQYSYRDLLLLLYVVVFSCLVYVPKSIAMIHISIGRTYQDQL